MTELKPCPHCGEDQTLTIYVNHVTTSFIECVCGARVQIENYDAMPGQMLDDLIELWNRRTNC
ncbi:MAG: Lar family restriction alleviation protein [Clostridiales bacterium]|nr:Lar family restriction alleviation protein [Clostridiales bacterium]MBQ1573861.1 Lar family restriction alleviation protein [Clostridiales bacterium]